MAAELPAPGGPIPIARGRRFSTAQWLSLVYNHPGRPPTAQRDILTALAVTYLDWGDGTGYASIAMLAEYTGHTQGTVKAALRWARSARLLVQTKRGHRIDDKRAVASEWRLQCAPPVADSASAEGESLVS